MLLQQENLNTEAQISEFDQWLTPKLERVKDSEKFNSELNSLCECIQAISEYLDDFSDPELCSVDGLCAAVITASDSLITGQSFVDDEQRVTNFYMAFFNLLFLTSGATDNNLKNHFLIKLKHDDLKPVIPRRRILKNGDVRFKFFSIPSPTKFDFMAKSLASCFVGSHQRYQNLVKVEPFSDLSVVLKVLLKEYTSLILEDEEETIQLWAICRSYNSLNQAYPQGTLGKYLLNSCTIFKVRGSVSASGGHITEDLLRRKLLKIGLHPDSDFNKTDVIIGEEEVIEGGERKKKTRAYDFILPYKIDNWEPKPKLFIQSQFYAGDSGSVSHKVVDQTQSSRAFTLEKYPNARFVEYLDGAGYYASLRGDLKHMLSLDDTASFFQVRSILIRLRRELQVIGYITPIELEHSILTSDNPIQDNVLNSLLSDGYPTDEINRIALAYIERGYVEKVQGKLVVSPDRLDIARRLLILDVAANYSTKITDNQRQSHKYLLVPGYGENYGILESELTEIVCQKCKQIVITAPVFSNDISWLLDEGVFRRR